MMKNINRKGRTRFAIFLATDMDPESAYDEETIRRRQFFTLAHELGHILLHGRFLLNSQENMSRIPENVAGIMEVEAHWFAGQLLMPNYVFRSIVDLIPDQLADKCGVNVTPALKRLRNLEQNIKTSLIQSARLDKWPKFMGLSIPGVPVQATKLETWSSFAEAAASSEILYICTKCGLLHNEDILWTNECEDCGGKLVNAEGII